MLKRSAVITAACWLWGRVAIALCFVAVLPLLLRMAWGDWRFHKERCPEADYTLLQAIGFSIRAWWQDVN
jgi:hypothetical protein